MQVAKWGNSLAIRIPADVARALGLKVGDNVELHAMEDGELALITAEQRKKAALEALRRLARPLPDDYRFDRDALYDERW